jgi:hypothetical protein
MRNIWIGALALAASCFVALVVVGGTRQFSTGLRHSDRAFLGTSLTRSAFPYEGNVDDLFGDGRRYARLALPSGNVTELTTLLEATVAADIKEIFVEIYPFIRTRKGTGRRSKLLAATPVWVGGVTQFLDVSAKRIGLNARNSIRTEFGVKPEGIAGRVFVSDANMDNVYDGSSKGIAKRYPADYHQPRNARKLGAVVSEAKRKGIRLVFMSYPHSQTVADFIGPGSLAEMVDEMDIFSRDFGVEVWVPALSFSDEYFRDKGHLNQRGRERFLELFREKFVRQ